MAQLSESKVIGRVGVILLTLYLMASTGYLIYALDKAWPTETLCSGQAISKEPGTQANVSASPPSVAPATAAETPPQSSPADATLTPAAKPLNDLRLLCLVAIAGALGAQVHVIRSFYKYVGNRQLVWSWVPMYVLLPFSGTALALLFFFVVRGALGPSSGGATPSTPLGYIALAALVGMFTEETVLKLQEIAATLLGKKEAGKDALDDSAGNAQAAPKDEAPKEEEKRPEGS